jgi:hypothetical protein
MTFHQWEAVKFLYFLAKASLFFLVAEVISGFLAALQEGRPSFFSRPSWMVRTETSAQPATSFLS